MHTEGWDTCHLLGCGSVAKLCPALSNRMDCSMPGFPVLQYLLEFAETHVHWTPCYPMVMLSNHLILCGPLLFLPSRFPSIRVFSSESAFCIRCESTGASASASVLPMNIQGWFPLGLTGLISCCLRNSLMLAPWKKSYDQPRQHIKKQRHYFGNGPSSQSYGFSSSHVWMWELDHKESWVAKNWCFWAVVLEKTLESPLDYRENKPVNPKGSQPLIFIGRTDAEAEVPKLWPPDAKSQLIRKDPDVGQDWSQEEKRMTEVEMVGWHHWLDGHAFEQALGVGDGQGSLACCSPWGHKESDTTEWVEPKGLSKISRTTVQKYHYCPLVDSSVHESFKFVGKEAKSEAEYCPLAGCSGK